MWKLTGSRLFFLLLFSIVSCFTLSGDEVTYTAGIRNNATISSSGRSLYYYAPSTVQNYSVTEQEYNIYAGNGPSEILTYSGTSSDCFYLVVVFVKDGGMD
jgi:hypothetical protein